MNFIFHIRSLLISHPLCGTCRFTFTCFYMHYNFQIDLSPSHPNTSSLRSLMCRWEIFNISVGIRKLTRHKERPPTLRHIGKTHMDLTRNSWSLCFDKFRNCESFGSTCLQNVCVCLSSKVVSFVFFCVVLHKKYN